MIGAEHLQSNRSYEMFLTKMSEPASAQGSLMSVGNEGLPTEELIWQKQVEMCQTCVYSVP